jgi:hypothetical protein
MVLGATQTAFAAASSFKKGVSGSKVLPSVIEACDECLPPPPCSIGRLPAMHCWRFQIAPGVPLCWWYLEFRYGGAETSSIALTNDIESLG